MVAVAAGTSGGRSDATTWTASVKAAERLNSDWISIEPLGATTQCAGWAESRNGAAEPTGQNQGISDPGAGRSGLGAGRQQSE